MQLDFIKRENYPDLSRFYRDNMLSLEGINEFRSVIHSYYADNARLFEWRQTTDPYKIVVSEIMLQQTQTHRVAIKYPLFVNAFPDFVTLAHAQFVDVLTYWHGLGYNRRALALHKIAQCVVNDYGGVLPACPEILETFPGIGKATAASICAFAFNMPTIFIETNIRAVYIHTFFQSSLLISDKQLYPLVEATLDSTNPRLWYYALMDYGVTIKKIFKNPGRKSSHYSRQSKFEGSERQIRAMILRSLTTYKHLTFHSLCGMIDREPERIWKNAIKLASEGFIKNDKDSFWII